VRTLPYGFKREKGVMYYPLIKAGRKNVSFSCLLHLNDILDFSTREPTGISG
jgi:hypothetical protein